MFYCCWKVSYEFFYFPRRIERCEQLLSNACNIQDPALIFAIVEKSWKMTMHFGLTGETRENEAGNEKKIKEYRKRERGVDLTWHSFHTLW